MTFTHWHDVKRVLLKLLDKLCLCQIYIVSSRLLICSVVWCSKHIYCILHTITLGCFTGSVRICVLHVKVTIVTVTTVVLVTSSADMANDTFQKYDFLFILLYMHIYICMAHATTKSQLC